MARLLLIVICFSCLLACRAAGSLRPAVKGVVCDAATRQPLADVHILSFDLQDKLAVTAVSGMYSVAAIIDKSAPYPGNEPGRLKPHYDMFIVQKEGYLKDTINIYGAHGKTVKDVIVMDTVFLKK